MKTIRFETDADGIATLTIDVTDKPMNVLTPELLADLGTAIDRVKNDPAIKGAVLTSGKPAFIAGADLKDLARRYDQGISARDGYDASQEISVVYRRLETCGKPVAAAINGVALGGGYEICLACHHRVLADDPRAVVGLPEVTVGLLPGAGGTQRLPRIIGVEKALPLLAEGRHVKPAEALKLGMVDAVVPPADLIAAARRWVLANPGAQQPWDRKGFRIPGGANLALPNIGNTYAAGAALVAQKTLHNLPAPIAILSAVYEGTQVPIDTGLRIESKYFGKLLADPVSRNLMRTMFVNKGFADRLGRRPAGVPKVKVSKLGILGAGMMGSAIAFVSAAAGMEVVLLDSTAEAAERGKGYSAGLLKKEVERGRRTQAQAEELLARIRPTTDYAELTGADLVVEAVFEHRAIKADVTGKAEAVMPKTAVFASNTSTLPITGLAEASKRPKQFIGIHFFSPVDKMPLVEIIVGKKTSQETIARALDYVGQLKKTPIVVNDSRGFYTSRCFGTFVTEGQCMLLEGVAPALIENAARMAGMPVGPLAVSDEVTIELGWKVAQQTREDLGDAYVAPPNFAITEKMMALDRKGRRYGKGFYEYPQGGKKFLWPGLAQHWPPRADQPTLEELKKRFLVRQALEAARCFEEGVITDAAEADLGSILGWGYPAWTGGTLSYIDTIGIATFAAECKRMAKAYGERYKPSRWLLARAKNGQKFHDDSAAA
ncbi:MAG: 3-hydroxyacyl-CoA dehydrogenase NAD-binding domain-containing protein [Gammaproteobacteria bacterium]